MSLTSKSPKMVALVALAVGKESLPDYSHRFSPKTFTQPQLFACLALKVFLKLGYRGIEQHLRDLPAYAEWLGLKKIPDHTTLQKRAQDFFGKDVTEKLLDATIRLSLGRRRRVRRSALDASGFESRHVSAYYVRRRAKGQKTAKHPRMQRTTYRRFPKLAVLGDCATHLILAAVTTRGPTPDHLHFHEALDQAGRRIGLTDVLADAGYDSEDHHVYARYEHGVRLLMPAQIGRPTAKPPEGRFRRQMRSRLRTKRRRRRCGYTQRWQGETIFSMVKRNLTCELTARSYHAQNRELRLLCLVHNITICYVHRGFRQSKSGRNSEAEAVAC